MDEKEASTTTSVENMRISENAVVVFFQPLQSLLSEHLNFDEPLKGFPIYSLEKHILLAKMHERNVFQNRYAIKVDFLLSHFPQSVIVEV